MSTAVAEPARLHLAHTPEESHPRIGHTARSPEADPIRLLLVEDDPDAAALMIETLGDHFGAGSIIHRGTFRALRGESLESYDLVLSDMNLPDALGLEVLDLVLANRPDLPVVFVTAEGIMENAITAIRRGAYDYIVKTGDYLFSLPVIVEKNLALFHIKQENERLQRELEHSFDTLRQKNLELEQANSQLGEVVAKLETAASTDPLTGLANRRAFASALQRSFSEAMRYGRDLALVMIDLDGFKQLNDTMGHQQGDVMLQRAAKVLMDNCRRSDVAARFGGDEFVLMLPQADEPTAVNVANRVRGQFQDLAAKTLSEAGFRGGLTMSMGLVTLQSCDACEPHGFIAAADAALYSAKHAGKTCLMIHQPHDRPRRAPAAA